MFMNLFQPGQGPAGTGDFAGTGGLDYAIPRAVGTAPAFTAQPVPEIH